MRIAFFVTGFAYGDTMRSEAIIEAFLKKDLDTEIIIFGYDCSFNYFKYKYPTFKITGYNFSDSAMRFSTSKFLMKNFYLPFSWVYSLIKYRGLLKEFDPDLIISDFEPFANVVAKYFGKKCISVFGYDPKIYRDYPKKNKKLDLQSKFFEKFYGYSDLVIIPSFVKSKNYNNVRYVDPIVRRKKLAGENVLMKKLNLKKKPFLVMLGGSNFGLVLGEKIIELYDSFDEEFIIFGGKKTIPGYHFSGFKNNFLEYLKVCKGIITLAGNLTLSEALLFKKPILVFPIEDHIEQLLNAYSLRNVVMVKEGFSNFKRTINRFLKNLNTIKKNTKKLNLKGNGAEQVVRLAYEIV